MNVICFDMDGTIADLYKFPGWLENLRAENPTPYLMAEPMWNMVQLVHILNCLRLNGWEIRVITWLSKDSSEAYKETTREAKKAWLNKYNFPCDHFHGVAYGTTKFNSVRHCKPDRAILIDDNAKVRKGWRGESFDPTAGDLLEFLTSLAKSE